MLIQAVPRGMFQMFISISFVQGSFQYNIFFLSLIILSFPKFLLSPLLKELYLVNFLSEVYRNGTKMKACLVMA